MQLLEKQPKIVSIVDIRENFPPQSKVVHCHGVFDLLHPGHLQHLQEAKTLGDILVVSITPDQFVNKGPGRPAFTEQLRLQSLAALECVDFVVLNTEPTAVGAIHAIQPDIYVKGSEYQDHSKDVTGKITEEEEAVKSHGGHIHYTQGVVFSSSTLINEYIDPLAEDKKEFIRSLKEKYTLQQLIDWCNSLSELSAVIFGDAIIDEYQFVSPLGQSGKGIHMTAELDIKESYPGGSFAIANHLADFAGRVSLVTGTGASCTKLAEIYSDIDDRINVTHVQTLQDDTLTKKRYIMRDGSSTTKLFETYSSNTSLLCSSGVELALHTLQKAVQNADVLIVADFGNGLIGADIVNLLTRLNVPLALNTQTNSGNRGYNPVTKYARADFVSLNEPELRLAAHDKSSSIESIARSIMVDMSIKVLAVTRGVNGVLLFSSNKETVKVPALVDHAVDRVGAGDSFLSLASLAYAKGLPLDVIGFFGTLAAGLDVQIIGNKESVEKAALLKFMTRLYK